MPMALGQLAETIDAKLRGDANHMVRACAALDDAQPNEVSFLANRKYKKQAETTKAGAIIVSSADADILSDRTLLIAEDPYFAFREAVVALHGWRQQPEPGVSPQAFIHPTAEISELCTIRPFAYIAPRARIGKRCIIYPNGYIGKGAVLGDDCVLYPNVTVYDGCTLGDRVTLHAGCVIGQDGFGYATHQGVHHKIPQVGDVVIENDVEMGAGCVVDRATVGSTMIREGSKFSDLVAVGHGAHVGRHNLLVAQVGLAGSVTTGDYVVMGGQVGVAGHLSIGDGAQIAAKAGVMHDLQGGNQYGGVPAMLLIEAKRTLVAAIKLPELIKEFKQLKKRIAELEAKHREQIKEC